MSSPSPLERGLFREAEDGTPVFFPWGLSRTGYRMQDPAAKRRVMRTFQGVIAVVVGAGTWAGHRLAEAFESGAPTGEEALRILAVPVAIVVAALGGYAVWVGRLVESCPPSDLRIPTDERLREAAAQVAPWKLALIGLVLAALSAALLVLRPETGVLAALGVALGLGLAGFALHLRRLVRATGVGTDPPDRPGQDPG